ncbi:hypothetical protein OAJ75_05200 [Candidatus Pelagibacter sp.]|nr:hypothetical protein [Candidatus Pelagibacter sp.]
MPPGYDGALYHLPHQNWLKNEKIIFGLSNVQDRFGLISFFSYIGVNFWYDRYLAGLAFLQGIFFLTFFSFLFYLREFRLKFFDGIILSTLLTFPIWSRYIEPSYGLVDLSYGLIFFITTILGILILTLNNNKNFTINLFTLGCAFTFMLKPSGILVFLYAFIIFIILYQRKNLEITKYLKYFLLPFFATSIWIFKTFINSGCLVYPLVKSCFNVEWSDKISVIIISDSIKHFGTKYFRSVDLGYFVNFLNQYWYYLILFIILFIIITYFFTQKKINFGSNNLKFLLFILIIINFYFYFYFADSLKGFSHSPSASIEHTSLVIYKEIFVLNFVIINSAIISYIFFYGDNYNFRINENILLLSFISFCLFMWILSSPLPRLAYGYFASLSPALFIFFIDKKKRMLSSNKKSYLNYLVYFIVFIYFFIQPISKNLDNLKFDSKYVEKIKTKKRNGFGVKPDQVGISIVEKKHCWLENNCYFYNYDLNIRYLKFGYKLIKK